MGEEEPEGGLSTPNDNSMTELRQVGKGGHGTSLFCKEVGL